MCFCILRVASIASTGFWERHMVDLLRFNSTHAHTETRRVGETERSLQPLGRTNVLYCHNKSLNNQQEQREQKQEQEQEEAATQLPSSTPKPNTMPMPMPMLTLAQASLSLLPSCILHIERNFRSNLTAPKRKYKRISF